MFGITKKRAKNYSVDDIEHIIGIILSDRSKYLNYGSIAEKNIYSGYAIGRAFERDQQKLSDEFDCVAIHITFSALESLGVSEEFRIKALEIVLKNFEVGSSYRVFFLKRLGQYSSLDTKGLANKLVENLAVKDFPERFQAESDRILAQQFDIIQKNMKRYITAELGAKAS